MCIFFQYIHLRSATKVRLLSPPPIVKFWSRNSLNQLGYNCAQLCSNQLRPYSFPFGDLGIFLQSVCMRLVAELVSLPLSIANFDLKTVLIHRVSIVIPCATNHIDRTCIVSEMWVLSSIPKFISPAHLHWEFRSLHGLNKLGSIVFTCSIIVPALLLAYIRRYEDTNVS